MTKKSIIKSGYENQPKKTAISTNTNLWSGEFLPFGTQYYRAPSPLKENWDKDLARMAELGFNFVKFWIQWRWNHPAQNKYYFDDIDALMDLAQNYKLKVMLNTIFDVAPAWIYQLYPDASMLTLDGRRIGPQTQPHRQIGGLGYCFNHPQVAEHFFNFLSVAVNRYKDHPALAIWNVGSEPELTSSIAEMRLYADNADKIGDMLCYCKYCRAAFKTWLKQKYNTIANLNRSWNRNYDSFDQVEIPYTRNTFNDMIDWRMFFVYILGENVRKRFETTRLIDQGRHPLMCHHVFIQGFPLTSTANDPWNVGQYGDLHGCTQMDDTMMIDILRSCARNKPVISAEMLMSPGYTLDLPEVINENKLRRNIFSGLAGNLKGFIFWQYRPETLGREAPCWGLSHLDGGPTPWLDAYSRIGRVLQKNAKFLLEAHPLQAEVAIVYNPENQIFSWIATKNEKTATHSLAGLHRIFYEHNIPVDFIHATEFRQEILQQYKVIYIPFPYILNQHITAELHKWISNGGVLICECYCAGWIREEGRHATVIPGYGLHHVFKIRQQYAEPERKDQPIKMIVRKRIPGIKQGSLLWGTLVKESYYNDGAEVLATYPDGNPAITYARYKKGAAISIGSYLALSYFNSRKGSNASFIAGLIRQVGIEFPGVSGNAKIRIDLLHAAGSKMMLIVQNLENGSVENTIYLPGIKVKKLCEQFSGQILDLKKSVKGMTTRLRLKPGEVKVFREYGSS